MFRHSQLLLSSSVLEGKSLNFHFSSIYPSFLTTFHFLNFFLSSNRLIMLNFVFHFLKTFLIFYFILTVFSVNGVHPKVRKTLKLLRLRQINNGTFVRLNKATINMLRIAEPYIAWGYPNLKSVRELIYKRGYGKVNNQRIALTDNAIIEKSLGNFFLNLFLFLYLISHSLFPLIIFSMIQISTVIFFSFDKQI